MSADNFLNIVKIGDKWIGRDCWDECEDNCQTCQKHNVFECDTLEEAVKEAQAELGREIYEYGIKFRGL